jgi:hypothetical protein
VKRVYLDQMMWVNLAKAYFSHKDGAKYKQVLEYLLNNFIVLAGGTMAVATGPENNVFFTTVPALIDTHAICIGTAIDY